MIPSCRVLAVTQDLAMSPTRNQTSEPTNQWANGTNQPMSVSVRYPTNVPTDQSQRELSIAKK